MPWSIKKKGLLGGEYTETRDDTGRKLSESREKVGFLGEPYTETQDDTGRKVGESSTKQDVWGDEYTEARDNEGRKIGESRTKKDIWGDEYTETRDSEGRKVGESRSKKDIWGDDYTEHKGVPGPAPRRGQPNADSDGDGGSGDLTTFLGKVLGFFIIVGVVLWLVAMALAITIVLSPIWLGAVAVGAIAGFVLANKAAAKIRSDALPTIPVLEEQKRKRTRLRIEQDFLKASVRLNPELLILVGATLVYGLTLAVWPFFSTADTFTRILLSVGVVGGTVLGTKVGKRVFLWQFEGNIFERAGTLNAPRLLAPKLALGLAIPGLVALAGVWIVAISQGPDSFDFARAFGFKDTNASRSTAGASRSSGASPSPKLGPSQSSQQPLPTSLGPSVTSRAIPEGFSIPQNSVSPDRKFGVLVPDQTRFQDGVKGQNKLIEISSGRVLATIDAESWFQDSVVQMNHGAAAAHWSRDGSVLAWVVGGKWAPRAVNLLKVSNGEVEWQRDVLGAAQREILTQTRNSDAQAYEAAKKENRGNGAAYPDGFTIDMELPEAGFTLPLTCTATLDSNPKQIDGHTSLRSSLRVTVDEAGQLTFSGMRLHSSPGPSSADERTPSVQEFIQSRLNIEASHDVGRILDTYADRVSYWDNGVVDRDFIRKDKSAYFERWPVTREVIEGPIDVAQNGNDWIAQFKTRFRAENPAKGVVIQGLQEATWSLRLTDGTFKIVAENGQILEKQRFENAPLTASVPQQGSYPGERFPQTRQVPLVPQDLQKLSADDLRYAINEMFARHGADFPKEEVKSQFARFPWYRPRPGVDVDEIESRFFSQMEKDNLKLLGEARNQAGSRGSPAMTQPSGGGSSLRPGPKSRFVTTRDLKNLAGQSVKDTWFYGDFVAASLSGNTVVMYPAWGGGFIRGYTTEIRATFRAGLPPFPGLERLPMDPIDSNVGITIDQSRPLRITSVTPTLKPGTKVRMVVVNAEQ
jgi:hypothetical protein